ncbi:MAG: hypothetical protein CO092_00830 [Candidatus Aenigmarchaeota archaeon CG_4_9_14_3_um_filter_37_18]|nr:MAG: hypothetical protein AUK23_01650 [Deltaproteobacteria bacterium CG2_30_43_15]PIW41622.1 MAG: hypothetical protein COW21_00850 [Candidatus Aenigmarchaeota archaeon CG15_BIG_FIL_POST_REV_8_21_14_020_37_27]PJB75835.1 MAG: hypothetical protein CO092_00830 [Candidatus Aenigmarchaeota archaeon CG_4_9_14_3_um_filter_37_18]
MPWLEYTYKTDNTYCYEIPREIWVGQINKETQCRELHWFVNATDSTYKNDLEGPILGGLVKDDDTEYPSFSNPEYNRKPMYNQPMPVSIQITDFSGISSAVLSYDYDYSTGIDGINDTPDISGDIYTFTIQPACPDETDPEKCEYKWKNMKFWIEATDNDDDRPDDRLSGTFTSPDGSKSILIDPPGEEPKIEQTHDPYIYVYGPSQTQVSIKECSYYPFTVDAEDPDGDQLAYVWFIDGKKVFEGKGFTYQTHRGDAGRHEIKAIVSDGALTDSHAWIVSVVPGYCETGTTVTQPNAVYTESTDPTKGASVKESTSATTGSFISPNLKYTLLSFMLTMVILGVPLFLFTVKKNKSKPENKTKRKLKK